MENRFGGVSWFVDLGGFVVEGAEVGGGGEGEG